MKSLSRVWLLATPWTAAYQAPLSMRFSRQEYWSGVCCNSWGRKESDTTDRLNWTELIYHIAYSFISQHLSCFCLLMIMNSATVNMEIQVSLQDPDVKKGFGYLPRSGIATSYVALVLRFWRTPTLIFHRSCTILQLLPILQKVPISPHPCQQLLFSAYW